VTSYSRLDYYEKVYDQRTETFIQCHINAFNYFGGIPSIVKIDNLKAAILEANFYEPVYQRQYLEFAEYYKFKSIPCRVYRPNDKGKVESGIKYVKNNFFAHKKFINGTDVDNQLKNWTEKTCNARIHGTTRKIPREVFENEERSKLSSLPDTEYKLSKLGLRKVYHDCHVYIDYNYYSVPYEYSGNDVEIEVTNELVKIYLNNKQISIHPRLKSKGEFSTNPSHYPKYKIKPITEYQEEYHAKMIKVGNYAEQLFFLIINEKPNEWMRTIQGILSLNKSYPEEILNLACKRALAYNISQYRTIKNICSTGSYNLPVEFTIEEQNYEYVKN
jgi:hypothetical protein